MVYVVACGRCRAYVCNDANCLNWQCGCGTATINLLEDASDEYTAGHEMREGEYVMVHASDAETEDDSVDSDAETVIYESDDGQQHAVKRVQDGVMHSWRCTCCHRWAHVKSQVTHSRHCPVGRQ